MPTSKSSKQKVNVAVVGLGFMGVTHLRAYQQINAARIVAVCDAIRLPVNGVLRGVAGNIGKSDDIALGKNVQVATKLDDVLANPDVELVDLCTPTPLHPEQSIAALRSDKHVLCEKPLARTSADARKVLKASISARGFIMPAMCMRFWPGWSWLKQVVDEEPYGCLLAARFRRLSEMPGWSKGTYGGSTDLGGALFDLHIHDTDFVQFLFGRPISVFSTGVTSPAGSINHVTTQYSYRKGPAVYAEGSWLLAKGFHMSYTLQCERATLDFDLSRGPDAMQVTEHGKNTRAMKFSGPDGYRTEIAYMISAVQSGKKPAVVTAADAVSALEICEAEEKSVRAGKVVKL
jgi:predicted dehydrogenase